MKVGIISDIHSNVRALEAMLLEFEKLNVDKILVLGDIVGIGNDANTVIDILRKYEDKCEMIIGNHEKYLIDGLPDIVHGDRSMDQDEVNNHLWNHSKISDDNVNFIKSLETYKYVNINGKKIYMVHYPINVKGDYILQSEDYHDYLNNIQADIYLFGHTHKRLFESDKMIINPGSLGCPKNTNAALGGLLIIDDNISYEEINVSYDIDSTIDEILNSDMPMKEDIIKIFYRA